MWTRSSLSLLTAQPHVDGADLGLASFRFYGISKVNLVREFGIDPIKEADESRRCCFPLGGFHRPSRHLASYFLHEQNIFRDKFALSPIKYENTYLLSLSGCFSLVSAAPHPPVGKDLYNCNYASVMTCLPPPAHQPAPACCTFGRRSRSLSGLRCWRDQRELCPPQSGRSRARPRICFAFPFF